MLACSFLIKSSSKLLLTRTGIKARSSSILGRIRPLILELLALEWRKFHTFELEYLWSQLVSLDQILCVVSLGWGKGCIRFWGRLTWHIGLRWAIVALWATCFFFFFFSWNTWSERLPSNPKSSNPGRLRNVNRTIVMETGTRLVLELLRNKNKHGGWVNAASARTGRFWSKYLLFWISDWRTYIGSAIMYKNISCTKWLSTNDGTDWMTRSSWYLALAPHDLQFYVALRRHNYSENTCKVHEFQD